jgi:hypothetical protein
MYREPEAPSPGERRAGRVLRTDQEETMSTFVAYEVAIELVRELRQIVEVVGKHDSNLADQMKRAGTSVV